MNALPLNLELEEIFGSWNSTVLVIEDLIQAVGNHRATMILDKFYKALSSAKPLLTGPINQMSPAIFLLAWEIKFKRGLHLHDECYNTDTNYDLPQPLKKTTHIYAVTTAAKTSFNHKGYQKSEMPLTSILNGWPAEPLLH